MTKETWSINALAAELDMDRRTLNKRLKGLKPAETKNLGNRTEKRYYLADVVAHLHRPNNPAAERKRLEEQADEGIKYFVGQELFPKLTDAPEFANVVINGTREELGLTKEQAVRVYQLTCFAIVTGLSAGFQDEEMNFELGDFSQAIKDAGGPEAWVAANWQEDS